MADSEREHGRYTETVSDNDILALFDASPDPVLTASEMAEMLPIGRRAITKRLHNLADEGRVKSKEVGARAVVWWRTEESEQSAEWEKAFGAFKDTDLADHVEKTREELGEGFEEREDELLGQ